MPEPIHDMGMCHKKMGMDSFARLENPFQGGYMAYTPPIFSELLQKTHNLIHTFSAIARRYNPPGRASLDSPKEWSEIYKLPSLASDNPSSLDVLLVLINEEMLKKKNCSDRASQIEVFRKLYTELFPVALQSNEENKKAALQMLLGALFHRYYRIIAEYSWSYSFWGTRDEEEVKKRCRRQCRLFVVIEDILGITKENHLDPLTVTTCCQTFRANMELDDNYKKFPHFKDDPNFFIYLDRIIKEQEQKSTPYKKQIEGIDFLESLAEMVEQLHQNVHSALEDVFKTLENSSSHEKFSLDIVRELSLENIKNPGIRKKVVELISSACNYICSETPEKSEDVLWFKEVVTACLNSRSQYALFGAFVAMLYRPIKMEQLTKSLKLVLECSSENNINADHQACFQGLDMLQRWLLDSGSEGSHFQLNCKTWGSLDVFKDQVTLQRAEFLKLVEKENEKQISFSLL